MNKHPGRSLLPAGHGCQVGQWKKHTCLGDRAFCRFAETIFRARFSAGGLWDLQAKHGGYHPTRSQEKN